ncbi:hypothetical protein SSX86_007354 [Deinandra increscens subsp. villosa]|uniref:RBR-type E3 ubiquitin transferase n=1 Tax=Deinandra increscens subsp. villosa TaxID=3103831 RepID=A0AAP0H612_9ASTR
MNPYRKPKTKQQEDDEEEIFTCEICIEPINRRFKNSDKCVHPFCTDCVIKYIQVKLEDGASDIKCPATTCTHPLEVLSSSSSITRGLLVKWCEALCESTVLGVNRVYCPDRECSELILNECGDGNLTRCACPSCKKPFCFRCQVPWHEGSSCGETKDENDIAFDVLYKKSNWRICPKCGNCVEHNGGCLVILCRLPPVMLIRMSTVGGGGKYEEKDAEMLGFLSHNRGKEEGSSSVPSGAVDIGEHESNSGEMPKSPDKVFVCGLEITESAVGINSDGESGGVIEKNTKEISVNVVNDAGPFGKRQVVVGDDLKSPYYKRDVVIKCRYTKEEHAIWDMLNEDPEAFKEKIDKFNEVENASSKTKLDVDALFVTRYGPGTGMRLLKSLIPGKVVQCEIIDC